MGIGDSLMCSGEARKLYKSNHLPSVIVDRYGRPYWEDVWDNVSYILKRPAGRPCNTLHNHPGCRPYIAGKTAKNWTWRKYTPIPAEIVFTPEELAFAEPCRGMIMIEPNTKNIGHQNKAWLADRWLAVSKTRKDFVQCMPTGTVGTLLLPGVRHVVTPNFRLAAAVLSVCRAFAGTEGGLMHAAAAVSTPAVVIFGGFIGPSVTGYPNHRNLFTGEGLGCGNRFDCKHCQECMQRITVEDVTRALEGILT